MTTKQQVHIRSTRQPHSTLTLEESPVSTLALLLINFHCSSAYSCISHLAVNRLLCDNSRWMRRKPPPAVMDPTSAEGRWSHICFCCYCLMLLLCSVKWWNERGEIETKSGCWSRSVNVETQHPSRITLLSVQIALCQLVFVLANTNQQTSPCGISISLQTSARLKPNATTHTSNATFSLPAQPQPSTKQIKRPTMDAVTNIERTNLMFL